MLLCRCVYREERCDFYFLNQSPQLHTGELSESCVRLLLSVMVLSPLPQSQRPQLNLQHQHHSPGSQTQVCRSHWSEQRLWAGQGDEMQGLPTLQPVSTLTALDGRGREGASGRTPSRTPCRETRE